MKVLNYVADMTCIDNNGEWTFKPGYDPQKVLDAIQSMNTYVIVYQDNLYWVCQADDVVHAYEQFKNAEPDEDVNKIGLIVWITP